LVLVVHQIRAVLILFLILSLQSAVVVEEWVRRVQLAVRAVAAEVVVRLLVEQVLLVRVLLVEPTK
jgi:hypothetical protein